MNRSVLSAGVALAILFSTTGVGRADDAPRLSCAPDAAVTEQGENSTSYFCTVSPPGWFGCPTPVPEEVKQGYDALKRCDFLSAIKRLEIGIHKKADCYDCFLLRGYAYREIWMRNMDPGAAAHAISNFGIAIGLRPRVAVAYGERGHIYRITGRYAEAQQDYTSAIEYNQTEQYYLLERGLAYSQGCNPNSLQECKLDSALIDFTNIINKPRDNTLKVRALVSRAFVRLNVVQPGKRGAAEYLDKADRDLSAALELQPRNVVQCVIKLGQGMVFLARGRETHTKGYEYVTVQMKYCALEARRDFGLSRDPSFGFRSRESDD